LQLLHEQHSIKDMAGYNIIGDIHGMDLWKQMVDDSLTNVFVGDFFDPYSRSTTFEFCKENYLEIIDYKKRNPATIILWGNHELHYLFHGIIDETYSRFWYGHEDEIRTLLEENSSYFNGIAYSIGNKYLVTHAGVSRYWYKRWLGEYDGHTPDDVAEQLNNLWDINPKAFSVKANRINSFDENGLTDSPLWMRSWLLERCNLFEDNNYYQVFGHTCCDKVKEWNRLVCVDCQKRETDIDKIKKMSYRIEVE